MSCSNRNRLAIRPIFCNLQIYDVYIFPSNWTQLEQVPQLCKQYRFETEQTTSMQHKPENSNMFPSKAVL